jgi:hypothetical protein
MPQSTTNKQSEKEDKSSSVNNNNNNNNNNNIDQSQTKKRNVSWANESKIEAVVEYEVSQYESDLESLGGQYSSGGISTSSSQSSNSKSTKCCTIM